MNLKDRVKDIKIKWEMYRLVHNRKPQAAQAMQRPDLQDLQCTAGYD